MRHPGETVRKVPPGTRQRGVTLIEIIVVLVILGVLTAVAVPRIIDIGTDDVAVEDSIRAHLRYAQSRAMNTDDIMGIAFSGSSYQFMNFDDNTALILPNEDSTTVTLPSGYSTVSVSIGFNNQGVPYLYSSGSYTKMTTSRQISADTSKFSVSVTPYTGFVQ